MLKLRLSTSYNDINKQISLLENSGSKQKAMKPERNKGFYMWALIYYIYKFEEMQLVSTIW